MAYKLYEKKYEGISQDIGNPNFQDEKGDYSLYSLNKLEYKYKGDITNIIEEVDYGSIAKKSDNINEPTNTFDCDTEESNIKYIKEHKNEFRIQTVKGGGFYLNKSYGVIPEEGDQITVYIKGGIDIIGIDLNGKKIYFKNEELIEKERLEWLQNNRKRELLKLEENKKEMDKNYNSLNPIFKERINILRQQNENFRIEPMGEKYEVFTYKQAMELIKNFKTTKEIELFKNLDKKDKIRKIPKWSKDHSGLTESRAILFAKLYLEGKLPEINNNLKNKEN